MVEIKVPKRPMGKNKAAIPFTNKRPKPNNLQGGSGFFGFWFSQFLTKANISSYSTTTEEENPLQILAPRASNVLG